MRANARSFRRLLLLLTLAAFALRIYHLDYQSLWRDEADALRFATQPWPLLLAMFRKPGENGPLYFLSLRSWLAVAGQSEFALRFLSACSGTFAVPLAYALMRRLGSGSARLAGGRTVALLVAAFMATAPYLIWYGQEAKMYALLTILIPLAFLLVFDISRRGGWWRYLLLYLLTGVSFYTHVLAVLAVPVQALWLLVMPVGLPAVVRRRRLAAVAYLAALSLPYLPLARWEIQALLSPAQRVGQPVASLPDIASVLTIAYTRGILPGERLMSAPALLALLAGVFLWVWPGLRLFVDDPPVGIAAGSAATAGVDEANEGRMHKRLAGARGLRNVLLLLLWLVLPPIELYLISLMMPLFLDRYVIWIMPAFLALAAGGVVTLCRLWRPLGFLVAGAILALNMAGLAAQTGQPVKSDFRSAAHFVMAHQQPGDVLIFQIPYNRYTFTYYAGQTFAWLDGPYTNRGEDQSTVDDWLVRGTTGTKSAWLIASEAPLWDTRGLTQLWLAQHGQVTDHADYARVSVTRYRLTQ